MIDPATQTRSDIFERVGRPIGDALAAVGDVSIFGGRALLEMWRPPYEVRETAASPSVVARARTR